MSKTQDMTFLLRLVWMKTTLHQKVFTLSTHWQEMDLTSFDFGTISQVWSSLMQILLLPLLSSMLYLQLFIQLQWHFPFLFFNTKMYYI
jgi:hypothetical protein